MLSSVCISYKLISWRPSILKASPASGQEEICTLFSRPIQRSLSVKTASPLFSWQSAERMRNLLRRFTSTERRRERIWVAALWRRSFTLWILGVRAGRARQRTFFLTSVWRGQGGVAGPLVWICWQEHSHGYSFVFYTCRCCFTDEIWAKPLSVPCVHMMDVLLFSSLHTWKFYCHRIWTNKHNGAPSVSWTGNTQ